MQSLQAQANGSTGLGAENVLRTEVRHPVCLFTGQFLDFRYQLKVGPCTTPFHISLCVDQAPVSFHILPLPDHTISSQKHGRTGGPSRRDSYEAQPNLQELSRLREVSPTKSRKYKLKKGKKQPGIVVCTYVSAVY